MLQVAGWMLACIRPSSNLPALLLQNIHGTFKACINMVTNCLIDTPPMDLTTFQQLLEPRSRPHIPGELSVFDVHHSSSHSAQLLGQCMGPALQQMLNMLQLQQCLHICCPCLLSSCCTSVQADMQVKCNARTTAILAV
jgi:hypothetical protein